MKLKRWRLGFLLLFACLMTGLILIVPDAYAVSCDAKTDTNLNLGDCYTLNGTQSVKDVYKNPAILVNLLTHNIFVIAGFILFVLIIYVGYLFISGGTKGQEQAKTVLETAVAGFLLMFAAYWILQIISLVTGANILFKS